MGILISCEGGGDGVPERLRKSLPNYPDRPAKRKRKSKEKSRPGELPDRLSADEPGRYVANRLAQNLRAPLIVNPFSLDLINVTVSRRHRRLFPKLTRPWSEEERRILVQQIHLPYRQQIRQTIRQLLTRHSYLLHVSVRSYPSLERGTPRRADAGLLYDPARDEEVDICLDWIDEMYEEIPMLRVRRNYPRRGTLDSIPKAMRAEFAGRPYLGIELNINQAWCGRDLPIRDEVIDGISHCLQVITAYEETQAA